MPDESSKSNPNEPLSRHGMTPEEAIQRASAIPPPKTALFAIADRVQVTETFPHLGFRNATGVVIPSPESSDDGADLVWVEFDAPTRTPHGTSSAGIGATYLRAV